MNQEGREKQESQENREKRKNWENWKKAGKVRKKFGRSSLPRKLRSRGGVSVCIGSGIRRREKTAGKRNLNTEQGNGYE